MTGRSRGRVAPCAIYTVHEETRSACFLVEPQNQGWRFVSGLTSKPLRRFLPVWTQNRWYDFSSVWASKLMAMVCEWFNLKITWAVFTGLASKSLVTVSGDLTSKPVAMVSNGLTSKSVATVSDGLVSKTVVTVS
jgi:hypothetical protein